MTMEENVLRVRRQIEEAARRAGRDPAEILLVGASKTMPAESVRRAVRAGVRALGENRVQEMLEKLREGAYDGAELHFIGHLQSNKIRQIVGKVFLIESVDSLEKLREIHRQAEKLGIVQAVLIEVNIGGEASKSGVPPADLDALLEAASPLKSISVEGLMAIPPQAESPGETRQYFEAMRKLFVDISRNPYDNNNIKYLSMGMSGDFTEAIEAGSNLVRVGTAIFGSRDQIHF